MEKYSKFQGKNAGLIATSSDDFIDFMSKNYTQLERIRSTLVSVSKELDAIPVGTSSVRQITQTISPSQISAATNTSEELLQLARTSNLRRLTVSEASRIPGFTQSMHNAVRGGNAAVDRGAAELIVNNPGMGGAARIAVNELSEATQGTVSLVLLNRQNAQVVVEEVTDAAAAMNSTSLAIRRDNIVYPVTSSGAINTSDALSTVVSANGRTVVRQPASPGAGMPGSSSAAGAGRAGAQAPSGSPSAAGGAGGLGGGGGIGGAASGAADLAADAAAPLAGATRALKLFERTPTINEILFSIGIITSIAWAAAGLYGAYLLFSDEEKDQSNDAIGRIIGCLQNIPVDPSSEAMNLKRSLISKLSFLRDNINGESGESGKLISEIFDKDGLMQNFTGSVATGKNVDINDSYTMENLSQDIACVSDASSELVNLAKSNSEVTASDYPTGTKRPTGPSLGGSDQVGPTYTGSDGGTQSGSISNVTANSIVVNVTLSTGETYQVPISTKKPSIPQRFILYLANGRGPDNFFASPTFAAFVDPDQSSPIGGSGLVPNSIGSQNIEDRIASAIKYCYNNDIDSAIELRRFMIRQINSGVGFLKKLFTNEPEQRVLDRAIGFYASGSASSGDISEPMSRREMRQDRRERRRVDRANRRASDFSDNIIKNSQKNNESINKEDSAMNKLAQKKNKVDAYEYAVKGLEDSLTKAYYAGLNSMYNEKPKDKKKDLKDLYNIDEEGGIKAIQSAHPKSVHVGESMGDGSLIENSLEQQYKTEQKLLPTPTGNFTSKNAFFQHLYKLRKVAKDSGKKEAFELINETINKLEKI